MSAIAQASGLHQTPLPPAPRPAAQDDASKAKNYNGFIAGMFSGVTKLAVGHPFDTIKVRLQTTDRSQFRGPVDCLLQTLRHEGARGLYKGASPPLVGWACMDSVMLGSLTFYRKVLWEQFYSKRPPPPGLGPYDVDMAVKHPNLRPEVSKLPLSGHSIAGVMAGWTVSFIAAPIEHVKARLQIQYAADKSQRLYSGPIDCTRKILGAHGIRGLYHGLVATTIFRTWFFAWWGSYAAFTNYFSRHTELSLPSINFWAGGLSAQVFWLTSYPTDVIKQRIMTDPLGGALQDGERKYARWRDAAKDVWRRDGVKGYWRGFLPCFARSFPANALALVTFEGVMRALPK